jgi:hypothetical protein
MSQVERLNNVGDPVVLDGVSSGEDEVKIRNLRHTV